MKEKEALFKFLLRLADDSLIAGHRLSEWCSRGPILEEDLALTNMSLDMIGRTEALLNYAATIEDKGKNADQLAYLRPEHAYYNHLLCELPNGDFAQTITRQLFQAVYEKLLYQKLSNSSDEMLAAIAAKSLKEINYHVQHTAGWAIRLGDGTAISRNKMQTAIETLWPFTGELFETDETEQLLEKAGIIPAIGSIQPNWFKEISGIFEEATLSLPQDGQYMQTGGRNGIHTEFLGHTLCEMQYLPRTYPDAVW